MYKSAILFVTAHHSVDSFWLKLLEQQGYYLTVCSTLPQALDWLSQYQADLILIRLDRMGGDELLLMINYLQRTFTFPLLLLLDTDDEVQIVSYYRAGIDDHLLESMNPDLLLAKVEVWLRHSRMRPAVDNCIPETSHFELDTTHRLVRINDKPVKLTQLEYRLFALLLTNACAIFDTQVLIQKVWGYDHHQDPALLKHVIYRLRQKIELDPSQPRHILYISGQGYCFQPAMSETPYEEVSEL